MCNSRKTVHQEGFFSLMKAGICIEYKVLWVTKMVTYGKYEVSLVLENYEDHLK